MKFAAIGIALLLLAGTALADSEGCPTLNSYNTYMAFSSSSGSCTSQDGGARCVAYDPIVFSVETFGGVNFACTVHTFQWDFGDGTAAVNARQVIHSYVPGTYNVSIRITSPVQSFVLTSTITLSGRRVGNVSYAGPRRRRLRPT